MSDININDSIKDNNDYQYIKVDNVTKDLDIIINDLTRDMSI